MVQTKLKKSALGKKHQSANGGKKGDISKFRSQLDSLGLKIIEVTADGNCFFRALADQLDGDENAHQKYRGMVVEYIETHQEDFEPFIEDEVPFESYCKSMREDGTWAGNMELQAASLVTRSNICIHHSSSPRWYIRNFHAQGSRMVHISYHDGEHYNSVRLKDDPCTGPANTIIIKVDAAVSLTTDQEKNKHQNRKGDPGGGVSHSNSIKLVMIGSGCSEINKIEEVLQEVHGDVDAAIEYLIAEKNMVENDVKNDSQSSCLKEKILDGGNDPISEHSEDRIQHDNDQVVLEDEIPHSKSRNVKSETSSAHRTKRPERLSARNTQSNRENKKNKDKGKKKGEMRRPTQESTKVLHDMGALCI
ncbi:SEC-C motif-containing protein / OTU-like cysteine protease family protein isoform X2 [Wolffia australiana]